MSSKVHWNPIKAGIQTYDNTFFAIGKCDCCGRDRGLPCRIYLFSGITDCQLPIVSIHICGQCAIDCGLLTEEQKDKLPADIIPDMVSYKKE